MAGTVRNVITRRSYNFTNVGANDTLDIPLVRAMDVSDAKAIDVVVRVHALAGASATATIAIHSRAISLTNEEPNVDFTNSGELGTITLNNTTPTAPCLALGSLTPPFGHMIHIFIRGTQPASPVTLTCTLSIDLVLRDN